MLLRLAFCIAGISIYFLAPSDKPLMSIVQKKRLINFGMVGDITEISSKATEKLIVGTNPSVLASIFRAANNKEKAIQALQSKLNSLDRKLYSLEILSTYIYFGDYEGAMERAATLGYADESVGRLTTLLSIHQRTNGRDISCGSGDAAGVICCVEGYLSKYFNTSLFEHFRDLLRRFCENNPECAGKRCWAQTISSFVDGCSREYLSKLSLCSLKYLYDELGVLDALRLLVSKDPKIGEPYLKKFGVECSPSNKELVDILERVYSPSLFRISKKRGCLNDCIIELKNYYEREQPKCITLESSYCKRIGSIDKKPLRIRDTQ